MEFSDPYSYGYDQITVNPVRYVDYNDSESILQKNKNNFDLVSHNIQLEELERQNYYNYMKNPPPFSERGVHTRLKNRNYVENIEEHLRPETKKECKNKLDGFENKEKCSDCSENSNLFDLNSDMNMFLLVLVIVLATFCITQYMNTQYMNATLLGMLRPVESVSK